jgi:F-type H+-transporting ATPase subunit b
MNIPVELLVDAPYSAFELVNFNSATFYIGLINTGIVALAYFLLLHKKVVAILEKRKEQIKTDMEQATAAKERAEQAEKDYIEKISKSKEEALVIIEEAKKNAEKKAEDIVTEAKNSARVIVEKGNEDAARERKAALNNVKNSISTLVISAAGAVTKREISADNNVDIINDFLAQAESM